MKKISIIVITSLLSVKGFSQGINEKLLCSGKWFPVKYEEADGTIESVPKEDQNEYVEYKADGTFYSIEGKRLIKGQWVYNLSLKTVIITQNVSRNQPNKLVTKVVKLDDNELIISSKDAGGDLLKIHFIHRR